VEQVDQNGRRRIIIDDDAPVLGDGQIHDREVVAEEEDVVQTRGSRWDLATGWVRTLGLWIIVVLAVVETALAFRLGLLLAGANPSNGFVDFIYDTSGPLAGPFEGILTNRSVDRGVLEPSSAIAMIVYLAAALLLAAILWALTAGPSPAGERSEVSHSHRRSGTVFHGD
jgi:hypothetical protein